MVKAAAQAFCTDPAKMLKLKSFLAQLEFVGMLQMEGVIAKQNIEQNLEHQKSRSVVCYCLLFPLGPSIWEVI